MTRRRVKQLIAALAGENPKVPSNLLSALGKVQLSQLMDRERWDFEGLDALRLRGDEAGAAQSQGIADDALPWRSTGG